MKLFKKLAQATYKSSKHTQDPVAPLAQPLATASITSAQALHRDEEGEAKPTPAHRKSIAREKLEREYQELLDENKRLKEKSTLLLQLVRPHIRAQGTKLPVAFLHHGCTVAATTQNTRYFGASFKIFYVCV